MINLNVFSEEKAWSKKLKKKDFFFKSICDAFPKKYKFLNKKISLSLLLSNNKKIKILNKKFRKKNTHTDILSFPFRQKIKNIKEIYLGDIIISINKIKNKKDKKNIDDQLKKLFIHGLTHLLGYRHEKDKEFYVMNKVEKTFYNYMK